MPTKALEKRLESAWLSRIALWWCIVMLAAAIIYVAFTVHSIQLDSCRRGSESAKRQARISRQLGYLEDAKAADARAKLNCGRENSWF